jgi:nicotinamide-nucleotide amidase
MNGLKEVKAEIISTGSEIVQGAYPDTNSYQISRILNSTGILVLYHTAVGDDKEIIKTALSTAWGRSNIIIMTGGLGPTVDDLTRFAVSEIWEIPLEKDAPAEQMIKGHFSRRNIPMPEINIIQAMLPKGCIPVYNPTGTAPGFILYDESKQKALIALPGPEREWRPMLEGRVSDFLKNHFPSKIALATLTLRTIDVPESRINEQIAPLFGHLEGVVLSLLAKPGKVDIGLIARGESQKHAEELLEKAREKVLLHIDKNSVYGENEDTIEGVAARLLICRKMTIAVAESCTGGLLCKRLTDIPGSSSYLKEGVVAYSNEAKIKYLGVREKILKQYGAVSGEAAAEMASGVLKESGADIGISITGIAGPSGGSDEKPVGLVYFGMAFPGDVSTYRRIFTGDRAMIRERAADFALDLIRKALG